MDEMVLQNDVKQKAASEDISDAKILIVDDLLLLRELIKNYLSNEGFKNLYTAENGVEALEKVREIRPDILILDILMPEMNGFEVCRQIRASPDFSQIPILVQTGVEESEDRLEVFKVGATDLVLKPINGAELVARVKVHLQNVFMQRRQALYHQRMASELAAASKIQSSLLPSKDQMRQAREKTGFRMLAFYEASSELGGDFWGMRLLEGGRLAFFMADFSGHGVVSALNTFRLHTLLNQADLDWDHPKLWMQGVNEHLCRVLSVEHFATVFYGVLDPTNSTLHYSAAASPPVVIGTKAGDGELIDTSGLPLGISTDAKYEQKEYPFAPGAYTLLYSDALIETEGEDGEVLESEAVLAMAQERSSEMDPDVLINGILDIYPGKDRRPLPDDLTLLAFVREV
ncbi:fused response regulator/phosphatase [Aestuariispira insulae]|uniref:Sigma-B regulation protein RsbU (Phosphoserine phosphatase) n=1 Tax=Aestuariispira insulae TaxID=1461337 RepID=A0A3D9HX37_9PROT|nr:fused response regulator/phosphatase [Aestuariispira insulae]RED54068.1 sigma-B regulation protein RsbU (phosphoserine phosphatase) [Aestuariispira insulae]